MSPVKLQKVANYLSLQGVPLVPNLITYIIRAMFSCYLPHGLKVGKNLVLGYGGLGVVIHANSIIGNGCHIDQGVTIGGTSKKKDVPILGDDVYVGAGAKILGPIKIGSNVVIGANAVVLNDIPDNCVAVGVPAKIIKEGIKKSDYV